VLYEKQVPSRTGASKNSPRLKRGWVTTLSLLIIATLWITITILSTSAVRIGLFWWLIATLLLALLAALQIAAHRSNSKELRQTQCGLEERQRAYEKLAQERDLLRMLLDHLPENTYVKDLDGKFLLCNAHSLRIFKVTRYEDLLGKTDFDFFPREMAERWRAQEKEVLECGIPLLEVEDFQPWRPDNQQWVLSSLIPLRDTNGKTTGLLGLDRDITERKRVEEALRQSETRYRIVTELISDYAYAYDVLPDGSFVTAWSTGHSYSQLTGYEWDEIGSTYKLYHPDDVEMVKRHVAQTLQGQMTQGEYRIITRSGEVRWIYLRRQSEWDAEGKRVIRFYGVAQDITERKRLEAELQRYNQFLEVRVEERTGELRRAKDQIETIVLNISDAIALVHDSGDIQTINPAFKRMFGPKATLSIENLLWVVSDSKEVEILAGSLVTAIYDGENQRTEARVVSADGQELDIDVALVHINPINGENAALLLSAHDITYLKELERFKTRFVANAVHDLSSPLTALGTRLYLMRKTPERLEEHIRVLELQVNHIRDLVSDLRSLSEMDRGLSPLNREMLHLNTLVAQIVEQYEPVAQEKHQQLLFKPRANLPPARLDRRKCERIVVNFVSNAINYTPPGKKIEVSTDYDGEAVIFRIADEGIGIAKEDLPHIFERFYRSDRAKKTHEFGTGLGLSIVKEMVAAHGGTITVESAVDQGSTFTVRFPLKGS
jgi:PAS domain S-box-containing protein